MQFDSFIVIDDNNTSHLIKFNTHRVKKDRKANKLRELRKRSVKKGKIVMGEVEGSAIPFILNSYSNQPMMTIHANPRTHIHHTDLIEKSKITSDYRYKRKLKNKTARYRKRRFNINGKIDGINRVTEISKSTVKKIRKYTAEYGGISIDYIQDTMYSGTDILIKAYDKNVFSHLYLYNTETKYKVSFSNFIMISNMCGIHSDWVYGDGFRYTDDSIGIFDICIGVDDDLVIRLALHIDI